MKWSDIFRLYENNHKHLIKELDIELPPLKCSGNKKEI